MRLKKLPAEAIIHLFLPASLTLVWLSFIYSYNPLKVLGLFGVAIILYFGLSVWYHKVDKSLTKEVVFEYILLGSLAALIIFGSQATVQ